MVPYLMRSSWGVHFVPKQHALQSLALSAQSGRQHAVPTFYRCECVFICNTVHQAACVVAIANAVLHQLDLG